jgi:hypothetical protein
MTNSAKNQNYGTIFFTWCVPGLLLIVFGTLSGQLALTHFGVALISLGLIYYGRAKQHPRAWYMFWLGLSTIYLILGMTEVLSR